MISRTPLRPGRRLRLAGTAVLAGTLVLALAGCGDDPAASGAEPEHSERETTTSSTAATPEPQRPAADREQELRDAVAESVERFSAGDLAGLYALLSDGCRATVAEHDWIRAVEFSAASPDDIGAVTLTDLDVDDLTATRAVVRPVLDVPAAAAADAEEGAFAIDGEATVWIYQDGWRSTDCTAGPFFDAEPDEIGTPAAVPAPMTAGPVEVEVVELLVGEEVDDEHTWRLVVRATNTGSEDLAFDTETPECLDPDETFFGASAFAEAAELSLPARSERAVTIHAAVLGRGDCDEIGVRVNFVEDGQPSVVIPLPVPHG